MNRFDYNTHCDTRRFLTWCLRSAMIVAVIMLSSIEFAEGAPQPALSSGDLQKVTAWIASEVSHYHQPYCYRQSYGRGVGKPMHCAAGQAEDAGLCYTPCQPGYKGVGPVCWQSCAPGFRDDGAFCAKPGPYGRGAGYPWKFGDGLNDNGMRRRCNKANPQGCEKNGLIYYPKCREGFHAVGCCICSPNCPRGQTDIGVSCAKKSYGRGVGKPLSTCPTGQDKDAALCYPQCRSGYHGVGPVCWQNCPSGRTNCGAGCATSTKSCVTDTTKMVVSPLILAVNIVTLGSSSSATSAAKAASTFGKIKDTMKMIAKETKGARELARDVTSRGTYAYQLYDTTNMWVNDFVGDFEKMTTKRVVTELSRRFRGDALLWIKQQYAMNHLTLMLKSDGIETGQNVLTMVAAFDPSGVTGVIDAFANPKCATDQSFPAVTLLPPYAAPAPPPATPLLAEGFYTLTARHSGKCLDVAGAGLNNGANVQQWDCHNGNNQKWRLDSKGGGFYTLKALHSGKCLDVAGASGKSGANVQQWDCHGKDNQTWQLTYGGDGYFRLTARHSGKCLDVAGASGKSGANVLQWDCHNGNNQKWEIKK